MIRSSRGTLYRKVNRRRGGGFNKVTGVAMRLIAFVVLYALVSWFTLDLTKQSYYSSTQLKPPPLPDDDAAFLQSRHAPRWGLRHVPSQKHQEIFHRGNLTAKQQEAKTEHNDASSVVRSTPTSLLNHETIRNHLLAEAPWAESHGADHGTFLGAGLLYYSFAYAFQAKTIVVLGSGGGFVPRMLKQAQRDLELAGRPGPYETILIDAHIASAGWGSTFYAENTDTVMRTKFQDIHYMFNLTDDAFEVLKQQNKTSIDYLHVDADHSFEQSFKDFENYFSLLSPRGVVSFHDTCFDPDRQCRTGVPKTIAKISSQLDDYGLQLIDAHYLYRGIAFAIRKDAPGLDTPKERRINFCKNNAKALHKTSSGFSMNARRGSLSTLGDFYECEKRFNMTTLAAPCPNGRVRDKKGGCSICVPGMVGADCQEFLYEALRSVNDAENQIVHHREDKNQQRLVAAWLAERNSQHVLEVGGSLRPMSLLPFHAAKSFWSVDPLIDRPVWIEDETPSVRWLPCRYEDILVDGRYRSMLADVADSMDTIVCLDCNDVLEFNKLFQSFPRVKSVAFSYSSDKEEKLGQFLKQLDRSWEVESDVILDNKLGSELQPQETSARRLLFFIRS